LNFQCFLKNFLYWLRFTNFVVFFRADRKRPAIFFDTMNYNDKLIFYDGFPKKGINFVDIMPLIQDRETLECIVSDMAEAVTTENLAVVDARGFFFATPLMLSDKSCVSNIIPVRKKGKLPFAGDDLQQVFIEKEYGKDVVEFRLSDIAAGTPTGDTFEISFMDDILATGGTSLGLARAINNSKVVKDGKEYKVKIKEFIFLIEIDFLEGAKLLEDIAPVKSIIHV